MSEAKAAQDVDRLVRDYGERAFQFAYRLTGSVDEAKDLVQEAFRRVLAHWGKYDPAQSVEAWFFAILRNLYLDAAKRWERGHVVSFDDPVESARPGERVGASLVEAIPDRASAVEEVLERREGAQIVRRALRSLSAEHRTILELCAFEALEYREVARIVGCPVGTVRSRLSRARDALRREIERRTFGEALGDARRETERGRRRPGNEPAGAVSAEIDPNARVSS